MQLIDDRLFLSASDLVAFMECEHLAALDLRTLRGMETIAVSRDDTALLVARKGDEHEQASLERILAESRDVVVVPTVADGLGDLHEAVDRTTTAMRAGAEVIYQAALARRLLAWLCGLPRKGTHALSRVRRLQLRGVDTKLARHASPVPRPTMPVLEICSRSVRASPAQMHVILGSRERERFRLDEFSAFYRRLRRRYETRLTDGFAGTYPDPVEHCGLCRWSEHCSARCEADDHLSLVAGLGRAQAIRLSERASRHGRNSPWSQPRTARAHRTSHVRAAASAGPAAAARALNRRAGYELLRTPGGAGFARLPEPRPGDLFFDMEGDPFYEGDGLEYLFGVTRIEDGEPVFRSFWAHDRREEKVAFEAFVDFVIDGARGGSGIHVYHYAPYEPSALKRLMGRHGTREEEIDRLLREKILVDLYAVTRQAMRTLEAGLLDQADRGVLHGSATRRSPTLATRSCASRNGSRPAIRHPGRDRNVQRGRLPLDRGAARLAARPPRGGAGEFGVAIPWRASPEPHEASPEAAAVLDEIVRLEAALDRELARGSGRKAARSSGRAG